MYDQFGEEGLKGGGGGPPPGAGAGAGAGSFFSGQFPAGAGQTFMFSAGGPGARFAPTDPNMIFEYAPDDLLFYLH